MASVYGYVPEGGEEGGRVKLNPLFRKKKSKEIAKDRLRILLISDRINCSPEMMELIKKDIAKVLSRYIQIDPAKMEIEVSKRKINVFW
jgi:cell division topological specificity factor